MNPSVEPLPPELLAFEEYRECMRQRYANDRVVLADFFRTLMVGHVPAKATMLVSSMGYDNTIFNWEPRGRSQRVSFTFPTGMIPKSADTFLTLGLTDEHFSHLNIAILSDVIAEAWADAGGFAFSRPLALWRTLLNAPGVPLAAVENVRDIIRRAIATRSAAEANPNLIPATPALPPIRDENLAACQRGDADALTNWANALAAAGHAEVATRLRWLERFREQVAPTVQSWAKYGQGMMIFRDATRTWWSIGEEENSTTEDGQREAANLGRMIAAWNDYYPAFEWFFRVLQYVKVRVFALVITHRMPAYDHTYDFANAEHFAPLDSTATIAELSAEPLAL